MAERNIRYNKRQQEPSTPDQYGKLPPQAVELEELVLGAIMLEKEAIEQVDLIPEDFYKIAHQHIFSACLSLKNAHSPIDMFTVCDELKRSNKLEDSGGQWFVTSLTSKLSSAAHVDYHAAIVKQKAIARNLIKMATDIQSMAYDEGTDVADVLEFAERQFSEITVQNTAADYFDINQSIEDTVNYLSERQAKQERGEQPGIPTGLNALDRSLNGGWSAPDLIVIGGRPSMGKTQFAISFAKAAGLSGNETLFLSLEMTRIQLVMRMLNEQDGVSFYNMKNGKLSNEEWKLIEQKIAELERMKVNIADSISIRYIHNIKSLARRLHRQGKLKLLIIDYLGYIKTNLKFGIRQQEVGYITSELKSLAKELNIPVILLSQLNRPVKGQQVLKPELSDLRESGDIEQDADIVIFPHRPDYYESGVSDSDGRSWHNRGVLYMGKHREGQKNEKIYFQHDDRFKKIWDDDDFVKQEFNPVTATFQQLQSSFDKPSEIPF
jgi:replicative DNA helicase